MTTTNEARIEISTICNYKCVFCPYSSDFSRKKEIMSNDLFDKILDKILQEKQINTITLSGMGEILCDKDIIYKIRKIKKHRYKLNLLTNGSLLSKDLIDEFIDVGVDTIRISLHTTDSDQYRKITSVEEKIHKHVLDMIEYIRNHPAKQNMELIITCDIIDINKNNVDDLISKYSTIDLLEIWKPHNWTNWKNYRKQKINKSTCGRPFKGPLQIQVNGTMNMCCFDYNGKLEIGDLNNMSIREIYDSFNYHLIKQTHEINIENNLICKNCDQLYQDDPSIIIYNNKYSSEERIHRTSTNYENLEIK